MSTTLLGFFCAAAVFVLAVCASRADVLSGICALCVLGPYSIIFTNCDTYCTGQHIGLPMYPLILRDHTGDHPVLLFEPGDVYLLLCVIIFVIIALFVLYRHLGVL